MPIKTPLTKATPGWRYRGKVGLNVTLEEYVEAHSPFLVTFIDVTDPYADIPSPELAPLVPPPESTTEQDTTLQQPPVSSQWDMPDEFRPQLEVQPVNGLETLSAAAIGDHPVYIPPLRANMPRRQT